jgi:hypothetical protein
MGWQWGWAVLALTLGTWIVAGANEIRTDGQVKDWRVLGPFPNEKLDKPMAP